MLICRVVDPILCRLIDPSASSGDVAGRGSVDLPVVQYQVESLTTLFRFGGKSLSKACQSTQIGVSVHPSLVSRAEKGESKFWLELKDSINHRRLSQQCDLGPRQVSLFNRHD